MTTNDATTPDPMQDPDQVGQLFGEVFDLVDETVAGISDAEVDERLRALLAETAPPAEPADLDELGRILAGQGWHVSPLDPAKQIHDLAGPGAWDKACCVLRAAWEQASIAQCAAAAARRDAEVQTAAAARARRHAAEVTAGVNAYVDAALDRAEGILADARQQAARLVASAEQQAEEIVSAARLVVAEAEQQAEEIVSADWARPVPYAVSPFVAYEGALAAMSGRRVLLIEDSPGCGKTSWLAALDAHLAEVPEYPVALVDLLFAAGASHAGPRSSGAGLWGDLAGRVTDVLAEQGGLIELAGSAAPARLKMFAYLKTLVACQSSRAQRDAAVRAIAAAMDTTRLPAGSYCRSTTVTYPKYVQRQLDLDLVLVLDEPGPRPPTTGERTPVPDGSSCAQRCSRSQEAMSRPASTSTSRTCAARPGYAWSTGPTSPIAAW